MFVAGFGDDAVAVFERDNAAGELSFRELQRDGVGGVDGLLEPVGIAASPDGRHLYVTGSGDDAVAVFAPEPSAWLLQLGAILALAIRAGRVPCVRLPASFRTLSADSPRSSPARCTSVTSASRRPTLARGSWRRRGRRTSRLVAQRAVSVL